MAQTDAIESTRAYYGFISYSHADSQIARWLHKAIERYRVPKKLREAYGLPKKIFPVFLDREELPGGGDLPDHLTEALATSDHMIVICSPAAAASSWVNKEIATFKHLGQGGSIIPVIVEGEAETAFPKALTHLPDMDGNISDASDPTERLGADLQKHKDGRSNGLLKVVSGLLGLKFSELKDREVEAARARMRFAFGLVGLFALMFVGACGSLYVALDQNEKMQTAFISVLEQISEEMDEISQDFDAGRITTEEAEQRLKFPVRLMDTAFALAPDDPRLLEEEGRLRLVLARHFRNLGETEKSRAAAERADAIYERLGTHREDETLRMRNVSLTELGDSLVRDGDVQAALTTYQEALKIARELANRAPGNLVYARDVSVSLNKVADLRLRAGDVKEALAAYEESLDIALELIDLDPANFLYARDVSFSLERIADVRLSAGDVSEALAAYEESLNIRRELANRDPGNLQYVRDISISLDRIADVRLRAGNVDAALARYEESLDIAKDLVKRDPSNLEYPRDVAISLDNIADLRLRAGSEKEALDAYQESLSIRRELVNRDPDSHTYARDVSFSLDRIADVRLRAGEVSEALTAIEEGLRIRRDLAEWEPGNLEYRGDVGVSLYSLSRAYEQMGDKETACGYAREMVRQFESVLAVIPNDVEAKRRIDLGRQVETLVCNGGE